MEQAKLNEILRQCLKNNRKAQKELYTHFSKKMYGVCLRYCKNEPDAKDCLQESFIICFNKLDQFSFAGSFEGWLRKITINQCLKKLKNNHLWVEVNENQPEIDEESEPIWSKIKMNELMLLIDELPPSYHLVFNLFMIEGFSHKEISNKLNISESTSKTNLLKAKKWLKKRLVNNPSISASK